MTFITVLFPVMNGVKSVKPHRILNPGGREEAFLTVLLFALRDEMMSSLFTVVATSWTQAAGRRPFCTLLLFLLFLMIYALRDEPPSIF